MGLFYQTDTADGGEDSISGSSLRPSISFAMVAAQRALAVLLTETGNQSAADAFSASAAALQKQLKQFQSYGIQN